MLAQIARSGAFVGLIGLTACGAENGGPHSSPDETPSDETPSDQQPSDETPSDQQPGDETPSDQPPSDNTAFSFRFQEYFGTVQAIMAGEGWAGNLRAPLRDVLEVHHTLELDQTPTPFQPMTEAELSELADLSESFHLVSQVGGFGSAKPRFENDVDPSEQLQQWMLTITSDTDEWKNRLKTRALEVASLNFSNTFHWQVGNEIAAIGVSQNIERWQRQNGTWDEATGAQGKSNDLNTVAFYVEYFFAPAAEALRQAEETSGKDVSIALGSINGIHNEAAQAYLRSVLSYEIVGSLAPSLAGDRVWEHVDVATIHYLMNGKDPTDLDYYVKVLDDLQADLVDTRMVEGIWSTEELGNQAALDGGGASSTMRIFGRYLHWISLNQLNSDQVKCFFFGAGDGPEGSEGRLSLQYLAAHVGDGEISLANRQSHYQGHVESYAIEVSDSAKKILVATTNLDRDEQLSLEELEAKEAGLEAGAQYAFQGFGADGQSMVTATYDGAKFLFEPPPTVTSSDSLVLLY